MQENEIKVTYPSPQVKLSESIVVWYIITATTIIPSMLCLSAVLQSPAHADQYPKWVSVGLVWCIAGDILQQVPKSEDSTPQSLNLVVLLAYTIANFAFTLAFSSADDGDDDGPEMHLEKGLPLMGISIALFYQFDEGAQSAANAAFIGILGCLIWRACARIGYGLKSTTVYGSLPQWLGLTGVVALAVAHWVKLCDTPSGPAMPFSGADAHLVRSACYWMGLSCVVVSVTMNARPGH